MKTEIKDERLKNIVKGAETVFFKKGYANTSISDVCKLVNCSRTTLYSYFENKENLYLAVVDKSFKAFLNFFSTQKIERKNGLDKMLDFAKGYIAFSKQHPHNYKMILDFYTLLKGDSSMLALSLSNVDIETCSFFSKAKQKAEIPIVFLMNIISDGQKDGSIDNSIAAEILFLNVWAYLIGSSHLYNFSDTHPNVNLINVKLDSTEDNIVLFIRKILS